MTQFHETYMGKKFYEGQLPELIKVLKTISEQLSISNIKKDNLPTSTIRPPDDKMRWVFDKANSRVVTEDDSKNVFYTSYLSCPESVIQKVVDLHNNNIVFPDEPIGSNGYIDSYLLNCSECSQKDRERIVESIYIYLHKGRLYFGGNNTAPHDMIIKSEKAAADFIASTLPEATVVKKHDDRMDLELIDEFTIPPLLRGYRKFIKSAKIMDPQLAFALLQDESFLAEEFEAIILYEDNKYWIAKSKHGDYWMPIDNSDYRSDCLTILQLRLYEYRQAGSPNMMSSIQASFERCRINWLISIAQLFDDMAKATEAYGKLQEHEGYGETFDCEEYPFPLSFDDQTIAVKKWLEHQLTIL